MSELNKALAKEIVNRLIENKLFEFGNQQIEELLAKGDMKESLWIELLQDKNKIDSNETL